MDGWMDGVVRIGATFLLVSLVVDFVINLVVVFPFLVFLSPPPWVTGHQ
jgi:hypothetical protein